MRAILSVLGLGLVISVAPASAHWGTPWPVNATALVFPQTVAVQVQNVWAAPIICQGRLQTVTTSGRYYFHDFAMGPIWPGTYQYREIYTGMYDWVANAWASTQCGFAYSY